MRCLLCEKQFYVAADDILPIDHDVYCSVECVAESFPDLGGGAPIDQDALAHDLSMRHNIFDYLERPMAEGVGT